MKKDEAVYFVRLYTGGEERPIIETTREKLYEVVAKDRSGGFMGNYRIMDFQHLVEAYGMGDPVVYHADIPKDLEKKILKELDKIIKKDLESGLL